MRRVFIQTFGCQMNEYDSEQMVQILSPKGFERTSRMEDAELILINSCAVREKSENKALSFLGKLSAIKSLKPSTVIGFGGCVGQTEGPKLLSRFKFLDFAFGTNNYRELPQLIEPFEKNWETLEDFDLLLPSSRPESKSQAFLTITNGCDKFCSYCIVPFTRGREVSRSPEELIDEAAALVQKGAKEIMLLGQNVNSYWGKSKSGAFHSLYDLLKMFQNESEGGALKGLARLRYTTSHPRDFDENLARAFAELPILCEHLHLPFQAGSDSVLRRMRRFYTAETFLKKMELVRKYRPDISLSTDVIVGFPGETAEDFQQTMRVIKEVEFDNVYAFKYSTRNYTRSAKMEDDVSAQEKTDRITELLKVQRDVSARKYREDINQTIEVMLEGPSRWNANLWTGRSRKNRLVHLAPQDGFREGQILFAKVTEATHSWQLGEVNEVSPLLDSRPSHLRSDSLPLEHSSERSSVA